VRNIVRRLHLIPVFVVSLSTDFLEVEEYIELGYIVKTPSCNILNISAWDKAILPLLKSELTRENCHAQVRQWTYTEGSVSQERHSNFEYESGTRDHPQINHPNLFVPESHYQYNFSGKFGLLCWSHQLLLHEYITRGADSRKL
jgi:hypothetical protein